MAESKSLVSEILDDQMASLQDQTDEETQTSEEEVTEVESDNDEQTEVSEEETKQEDVITEADAKEYGISATFIGKPKTELAKIFREAQATLTRTNQELANLKKASDELQKSKVEIKEETGFDVDKIPDPLDDVDGFMKGLKVLLKKLEAPKVNMEELEQKILQKLMPYIQPAQELAVKNAETEVKKAVQAQLPKDIDVNKVMNEWAESEKDMLDYYKQTGVFAKNPKLLVKKIVDYYKTIAYDDLTKSTNEKIKKEVHERLKKASQTSLASANQSTYERSKNEKKSSLISEIGEDLAREQGIIK